MTQQEQLKDTCLKHEVDKAILAIENVDGMVNDKLNNSEYASEEYKQSQRLSNSLLRVKNMLDVVKYEL